MSAKSRCPNLWNIPIVSTFWIWHRLDRSTLWSICVLQAPTKWLLSRNDVCLRTHRCECMLVCVPVHTRTTKQHKHETIRTCQSPGWSVPGSPWERWHMCDSCYLVHLCSGCQAGAYSFHYVVVDAPNSSTGAKICFLTLAEKGCPRRLAFDYLDDLQKEFIQLHGQQVCATVCLSIGLSDCLVCLSVCLVCTSVFLSVYLVCQFCCQSAFVSASATK